MGDKEPRPPSRPVPLPFHLPGFKAHGSQTSSRKTPGLGNWALISGGLKANKTPAGWDRIRLEPGARATGERPGERTRSNCLSPPENYSRSPQPGTLRPPPRLPSGGSRPSPPASRTPGAGAAAGVGTPPGWGGDAHLGVRDTCAAPLPPPASPKLARVGEVPPGGPT